MQDATSIERIRRKFQSLSPVMDERLRRQWAATEATALGWGGVRAVAAATGMSHNTIIRGMRELQDQHHKPTAVDRRIRQVGGGRKSITQSDPSILNSLEALVSPSTRGDPQSPLRWTCKSTRNLAETLQRQGHRVRRETFA